MNGLEIHHGMQLPPLAQGSSAKHALPGQVRLCHLVLGCSPGRAPRLPSSETETRTKPGGLSPGRTQQACRRGRAGCANRERQVIPAQLHPNCATGVHAPHQGRGQAMLVSASRKQNMPS